MNENGKRPVPLYDFIVFGAAIKPTEKKKATKTKKETDELYIPRATLANTENKGQQPSLQVFYDLVTRYHISGRSIFLPEQQCGEIHRAAAA